MESNQNRNVAIDFCRAAATLMVINSHMAICYPAGLQAFATGGGVWQCFVFLLFRLRTFFEFGQLGFF